MVKRYITPRVLYQGMGLPGTGVISGMREAGVLETESFWKVFSRENFGGVGGEEDVPSWELTYPILRQLGR